MKAHLLILLIGAAMVCGCSRNAQLRKAAVDALRKSSTCDLKADATTLWAKHASSDSFDIPEADWPHSFSGFNPARVFRDSSGIYIVMAKHVSHTAGVYIVVKNGHIPKDAPNVSHERLSEGIFWTLGS